MSLQTLPWGRGASYPLPDVTQNLTISVPALKAFLPRDVTEINFSPLRGSVAQGLVVRPGISGGDRRWFESQLSFL